MANQAAKQSAVVIATGAVFNYHHLISTGDGHRAKITAATGRACGMDCSVIVTDYGYGKPISPSPR